MSQDRIRKALDQMLYLPHLQAQHAQPSLPTAAPTGGGGGSPGNAAGKGRPWDRGDLFRRLGTFKSGTWFCKPQCIGPVECALRGWTNTGPDMLTCEFCKAKLSCPIPADLLPEEAAAQGARYAERLSAAHDAACPWRTAASAPSLLQFPPLAEEAVRRDFDVRCAALHRLLCLPPVAEEAFAELSAAPRQSRLSALLLRQQRNAAASQPAGQPPAAAAAGSGAAAAAAGSSPADAARAAVLDGGVAALDSAAYEARARLLALCGWDLKLLATAGTPAGEAEPAGQQGQPGARAPDDGLPPHVGPESAALQCSLCGAKAGLWAFFPQCKPQVLQAPRRTLSAPAGGGGGGARGAAGSGLAWAPVSRNVAADMATTIAGGSMLSSGGAGAAPFGSAGQQPAVFGSPPAAAAEAAAGGDANGAAGSAEPASGASPFGGGPAGGSFPVFGFAALQAARPAGEAGGTPREQLAAGGASIKRKQPDFSWTAVMADIDAKAAAEKRARASTAAGGPDAAAAATASGAATSEGGQAGGGGRGQQDRVASLAAAQRFAGAQASPVDPLALHRPFCPWVNCTQAGEKDARCGWQWCLQQLTAAEGLQSGAAAADAGEEDGDADGNSRDWDPASLLRRVLQGVDVHK